MSARQKQQDDKQRNAVTLAVLIAADQEFQRRTQAAIERAEFLAALDAIPEAPEQ